MYIYNCPKCNGKIKMKNMIVNSEENMVMITIICKECNEAITIHARED